ncbi:MAG: pyridoxal phosphate-dependent aminotransferase, partial [Flavobacteriales bacterium]
IDENYTKYPPVNGYQDLREAISEKFKRDNGLTYAADQIVVSTGAKQSIINVVLSLIDPGDEVLLPTPFWVSYEEMVKLAEGKCVYIDSGIEHDFKITPAQLEKAITPKTKLMIFSSPCNPTGSVYTKEELQALALVLKKHNQVYVISDEIYEYINFIGKHESIAAIDGMYDKVITVNGVSKGYSMTGWRIGYIGAPKTIADACNKIQGQFTSGASSIAQRAALAAVKADPAIVKPMRDAFLKRRELILKLAADIPGFKSNIPQGAFYIFPDVSALLGKKTPRGNTISSPADLCMYFLQSVYVAVVTGEAFGNDKCIRISYAASEETITEAMKRMGEAVKKLV